MQDWQQRVIDENEELVERIARLTSFLIDTDAPVDNIERERLNIQLFHMRQYAQMLLERIRDFPQDPSINLQGPPAELNFTMTIIRAATGEIETYPMIGAATMEEIEALKQSGLPIEEK